MVDKKKSFWGKFRDRVKDTTYDVSEQGSYITGVVWNHTTATVKSAKDGVVDTVEGVGNAANDGYNWAEKRVQDVRDLPGDVYDAGKQKLREITGAAEAQKQATEIQARLDETTRQNAELARKIDRIANPEAARAADKAAEEAAKNALDNFVLSASEKLKPKVVENLRVRGVPANEIEARTAAALEEMRPIIIAERNDKGIDEGSWTDNHKKNIKIETISFVRINAAIDHYAISANMSSSDVQYWKNKYQPLSGVSGGHTPEKTAELKAAVAEWESTENAGKKARDKFTANATNNGKYPEGVSETERKAWADEEWNRRAAADKDSLQAKLRDGKLTAQGIEYKLAEIPKHEQIVKESLEAKIVRLEKQVAEKSATAATTAIPVTTPATTVIEPAVAPASTAATTAAPATMTLQSGATLEVAPMSRPVVPETTPAAATSPASAAAGMDDTGYNITPGMFTQGYADAQLDPVVTDAKPTKPEPAPITNTGIAETQGSGERALNNALGAANQKILKRTYQDIERFAETMGSSQAKTDEFKAFAKATVGERGEHIAQSWKKHADDAEAARKKFTDIIVNSKDSFFANSPDVNTPEKRAAWAEKEWKRLSGVDGTDQNMIAGSPTNANLFRVPDDKQIITMAKEAVGMKDNTNAVATATGVSEKLAAPKTVVTEVVAAATPKPKTPAAVSTTAQQLVAFITPTPLAAAQPVFDAKEAERKGQLAAKQLQMDAMYQQIKDNNLYLVNGTAFRNEKTGEYFRVNEQMRVVGVVVDKDGYTVKDKDGNYQLILKSAATVNNGTQWFDDKTTYQVSMKDAHLSIRQLGTNVLTTPNYDKLTGIPSPASAQPAATVAFGGNASIPTILPPGNSRSY